MDTIQRGHTLNLHIPQNRHFIIQERFNKLIYGINPRPAEPGYTVFTISVDSDQFASIEAT